MIVSVVLWLFVVIVIVIVLPVGVVVADCSLAAGCVGFYLWSE